MKEILVLVKRDIKDAVRYKLILLNVASGIVLTYLLATMGPKSIIALQGMGTTGTVPDLAGYIQSSISTIIFMVALVITLGYSQMFSGYTLLIDKTKRSLESLLCTPLSLRQFWFGKIMSVFVPSAILGIFFTLLAFCTINIFVVSPEVGHWVYPAAAPLIAILTGVPLAILFLSAMFHLLQLIITNVRIINGIFVVILVFTFSGLIAAPTLSVSSWSIVYITLGVAAVLAVVTFFLSRLLTKERIILSSKG